MGNYHTEEMARKKWCPFVRASTSEEDSNAANCGTSDNQRNPTYARCIASDCMAWRDKSSAMREGPMVVGYCGLAGRD